MTFQGHFESLTGKISQVIALIGLTGLLGLAFATVLDVLLRWLFNAPIAGVRDLSSLFIAIVIAASFPVCITERSNITIRFLGSALGPRCREILDLFGNAVTLVVLAVLSWLIWAYAVELSESNETTWILLWPVSPWYRGVAVIVGFCVLVEVSVILQIIRSLVKGNGSHRQEETTCGESGHSGE